jgi:FkbM family methyltransferase
MKFSKTRFNPFNYHFFRIYIYHPFLFFLNIFRYPKGIFKLLLQTFYSNHYSVYGFTIASPKKIDKYFFANLNTKFNSFILEKYEVNEKKLIEKHLNQNDIVLELGGCMGVISLLINNILNKKEGHIVIEIDSNKFEYLQLNRKLNNGKFKMLNGALSNNRNLYYKESNNFWGGKMVEYKTSKPVKAYNLPDLEQKFNLTFNTLVMDIEGGELEVIKKLNLISFEKLLFEIHFNREKNQYKTIEKRLKDNNFILKESYGRVEYWHRVK